MNDLVGSLWWDKGYGELIILVERLPRDPQAFGDSGYWEWRVFIFDAKKGITPNQLSINSRSFMNENAFISPVSVFNMERIA